MRLLKTWFLVGLVASAVAVVFVYFGVFNVAADVPHWSLTARLMQAVRDRSIAARAKDIDVPPLDDPLLIAEGGRHYADMCADCHLAPGTKAPEIRVGLYPTPPDLTQHTHAGAAEVFWIIKHGIKMSAMPAWGKTHDDQSIWGIVAFLQRLPELSPAQYEALVDANGDAHRHHDHDGHDHHDGAKQGSGDVHHRRQAGDAGSHK